MDAVMYLKEKARMTDACNISCDICPLSCRNTGLIIGCKDLEANVAEKAIEIVEAWSKDHQRKTYLSDFLEKYPNVKIDSYGIPYGICVEHLGYIDRCKHKDEPEITVNTCKKCWNTPMEE